MSRTVWLVLGVALVLTGCKQAANEAEQYDDSRNPFYKQAQADLESSNPSAAVADYEAALGANPKLAGAHYNLAVIYADRLNDPVGAIFHYKQFLALAPTSDKADDAKAAIDRQIQAFEATLPAPPTPAPSSDDLAKLQTENNELKKQVNVEMQMVNKLQAQIAKMPKHHLTGPTPMAMAEPPPAPPAPETPPPAAAPMAAPMVATDATNGAPAVPAAPPRAMPVDAATAAATPADVPATPPASSGPARSYKIVSGDSLWKISHKMYPGDTKNGIERIKEANKDILIEGKPLKIGQVLVIP
jgi:hypothetical protein